MTYNPDSNYVVYAGQVSDSKGVENLIKAWEMTNNTDLLLKIIGSGDKLEILRSKYIKPNIQFLGEKSNRESLEIIRNARAVVSATKMFEGQPRLLCEASSMGVPSIFPNFGGMSEFFPRDYQLMFHQYDYKDLTLKLKMLNDTILLNSLSLSIKKNIDEKLSSSKLIEKFERLHFSE